VKRQRVVLALALAATLPSAAWAQSAGQWKDSVHVWNSLCRYCHETPIGPALFGRSLPEEVVTYFVRAGRNAMPAFMPTQLNDADLRALARWINRQPAVAKP
jgi:mono/diheme cytochrome c family protein